MLRFTVTITRGDVWGMVQEVTLCAQDFLSAAAVAHWQRGGGYAETLRVESLGLLPAGHFEYDGKFEYGRR